MDWMLKRGGIICVGVRWVDAAGALVLGRGLLVACRAGFVFVLGAYCG